MLYGYFGMYAISFKGVCLIDVDDIYYQKINNTCSITHLNGAQ